jgi:hypothetical protein
MGYRIGRKYASETYPEAGRGGSSAGAFARNFAIGTGSSLPIPAAGTQVVWDPDVGTAASVNVPITPRSTGTILISGVIAVKAGEVEDTVTLLLAVLVNDGSPILPLEQVTIDPSGNVIVAFSTEVSGLPVGTLANIQVALSAGEDDALSVPSTTSTINIQEVSVSTG